MNPEPSWTALFREYYKPNIFPFYFLRPPVGFPHKEEYPDTMPKEHQRILHQLYYRNGGSFHELFHLLSKEIRIIKAISPTIKGNHGEDSNTMDSNHDSGDEEGEKTLTSDEIIDALLGNHDADKRGHEYHDNPEIFAAIRAIVERWPQPKDPLVGRSLNNIKETIKVHIIKPTTPEQSVKKALIAAASGGSIVHRKNVQTKSRRLQQVYPSKDRRAFALSAGGHPNLIYRKMIPFTEKGLAPVHIYIDVSGSMKYFIPQIMSAVISCKKWIQTDIYTFSNGVEKTDMSELQEGRFRTTRGTDILELTRHLKKNRFKNVVILTDGYVGPPDPETISYIKNKTKLHVVLTMNGFKKDLEILQPKFHIFQSNDK
jgi:hypothetical protein